MKKVITKKIMLIVLLVSMLCSCHSDRVEPLSETDLLDSTAIDNVPLSGEQEEISDTDNVISQLPDEQEVIVNPEHKDMTDTDGDEVTDIHEKHTYDAIPKDFDTDSQSLPDVIDNVVDTDEDGLSDEEEVNIYNTDPLNPDSDGDTVLDGDEVDFGLDPIDPSDGGTTFEQILSESDLSVNKYNNEFQVSISVVASNNVKRYLRQDISDYWGMLSDNRSIIGFPINIEYLAGTIVSGTITFRLDKDFVDNNEHYYPELGLGLERYALLVYDDEVGTMITIECSYDEENYSITTGAENMGNLLIMDVESLMFDLGIVP